MYAYVCVCFVCVYVYVCVWLVIVEIFKISQVYKSAM